MKCGLRDAHETADERCVRLRGIKTELIMIDSSEVLTDATELLSAEALDAPPQAYNARPRVGNSYR